MTGITIAGTATAFSLRLRLHYKAAHAAGVRLQGEVHRELENPRG